MADILDGEQLKRNILSDMRVGLKEEFDKNFERKAFFSDKWKKRQYKNPKGTLLAVSNTLRRSIKAEVRGNGVRFSSTVPYASVHNEGGSIQQNVRSHKRTSKKGKTYTVKAHPRTIKMPQRQFIGDGKETQEIIKGAINKNLKDFNVQLTKVLKK